LNRVTLEDVAKQAGVSLATVSRVVNDYPHVSAKVRQQVQDVIDQLGYNPNYIARSLATQRTGNIGLVFPNSIHNFFTDPYYPRLTEGIAHACNENDYTLSLFIFHTEELEKKLIPRLTGGGLVDGIIVQSTGIDDDVLFEIKEGNVPFLVAGRPLNLEDAHYIDVDNVAGAYNVVAHLIQNGRTSIGMITGAMNTAAGLDRLQGYKRALADRNIPVDDSKIAQGNFTEESGYYGAKTLITGNGAIDAIFSASDTMAVGALKALREQSLSVPEDIALVGFDDLPPAKSVVPSLTTIRQPIRRFGIKAVEMLIDIINNGQTTPQQMILSTELIVRESCGGN
jgi:DNA-binding LacI/PurR family transcriptional regulator